MIWRHLRRLALLALGVGLLAAPAFIDPRSATLQDGEQIEITAEKLSSPADYPLGGLKLIAALKLSSGDVRFGGWSGLHVEPNGDFVALSDRAFVMRGRISTNGDGVPDGLLNARIAVLKDSNGEAPSTLRGDSEGLTRTSDGRYILSFELKPRLMIYDFAADGLGAVPEDGPPLSQLEKLSNNQQLEAITTLTDGSILVGSERGENADSESLLWRVPPPFKSSAPSNTPFAKIKLPARFSLTEFAGAPDGSFYGLFRAYSPFTGVAAQIRHFDFTADGKTSETGDLIAELEPPFPTDNDEAMALTTGEDGVQRLYVLSDDNYRREQETILLVFEFPKAPAPAQN